MRHALAAVAAVVDHEAVAGLGDTKFFRERGGGEQEMAEGGLVAGRGFADAGNKFLRDHEHMHRCLRVDVVDGDAEVVFMRELGGDLAVNDFLEEGFHGEKITGESAIGSATSVLEFAQEETEETEV